MTDTPDSAAPAPLFKKRTAKAQTNLRKKRAATPPSASASSASDSDFSSDETNAIKRRKKNAAGVVTASSTSTTARSAPSDSTHPPTTTPLTLPDTNDATKQSNWYDEQPANLLGKTRTPIPPQTAVDAQPDGTYKGLAHQTHNTFIRKNPDAPSKKAVGPVRAPTNVRMTTFTDYAPDVCKDYKLTGWCGFGDNCKFLHDRSDYKAGWELDKEWETVTKGKKVVGTVVSDRARGNAGRERGNDAEDEEEEELEDIPFACIICQGPYKEPVVTKCGHYFCEPCALKRYRKDPSCAACGAATNGVFNSAKKLKRLLERKAEKQAQRRREAEENGEELSEDEEDE
ncbi:U2-type spliceosomal complex subunit CWC24 [Aspergillus saccharolyticus JOP 1030-1]|uniref:Pre-mRNA-splicing factor CWC24 n=1 Tax=Aspergillus saccharolyticus JOP 1030-1 TaxID=1450539 RepID=A0A318Z5T7_9EURO|nr:hypothetical protein BP01DRAFT_359364 [Aspergillus saccharolyticus JOP 1030-1]PYH42469.1 hypothetical protein BP01DRAFT_359364 [Aspergillus saccharolyticus JOP 1030-1]